MAHTETHSDIPKITSQEEILDLAERVEKDELELDVYLAAVQDRDRRLMEKMEKEQE